MNFLKLKDMCYIAELLLKTQLSIHRLEITLIY